MGEEDVLQQFERISSVVHKNIAYKMRKKVDVSRLEVIRCLGMFHRAVFRGGAGGGGGWLPSLGLRKNIGPLKGIV